MGNLRLSLALLLVGSTALAQSQPFGVPGLDFAPNNSQSVAPSGRLRLRYNSGTGALEMSISAGSYGAISGSVLADAPLSGNGTSGSHLTCPTCVTTSTAFAGDLSGTVPTGTVVALQTFAVASTTPTSSQVLRYSGSQWAPYTLTQDDIAAAFAVTLLAGFTATVEAGNTIVNPQFTDTHNQTPASATLVDYVPSTCTLSPATLTALGYGGAANTCAPTTYTYCSSLNCTRTWTYSATNAASVTKTASVTAKWSPRVYYGMAVPAAYDSAFIIALPSSALSATTALTFAYPAGGGTKEACYALPSSYTAPVSFIDTGTGFGVSYSRVAAAVSVTNAYGVAINYDVYCSDYLLVASFTGKWS